MSSFIPSAPLAAAPAIIANDGWYPDLDRDAFHAATGQGQTFGAPRIAAELLAAVIEINAALRAWRAEQTAASLADIPATQYGGVSEKVILYRTAVFARARAQLLATTRDYDSTKDGHNRADKQEATADDWMRQSAEAIARLTGRPRAIVELI